MSMPKPPNPEKPFTDRLRVWLRRPGPKTIVALNRVFEEKTLAIVIVVVMFLPALPLPTGGISHVFEVVAMLLSLQLVAGRRTIWLPRSWAAREISALSHPKTVDRMVGVLRWVERFSRPRLGGLLRSRAGVAVVGLLLFAFSLTAFLAPPFSGLDTLPSMGVVFMALGLIFEDVAVMAAGVVLGGLGVVTVVGLGALVVQALHRL